MEQSMTVRRAEVVTKRKTNLGVVVGNFNRRCGRRLVSRCCAAACRMSEETRPARRTRSNLRRNRVNQTLQEDTKLPKGFINTKSPSTSPPVRILELTDSEGNREGRRRTAWTWRRSKTNSIEAQSKPSSSPGPNY
ncbi:hypothetical protein SDJN03_10602, partial [Cucurbita argyrosperma subsp. sororia]